MGPTPRSSPPTATLREASLVGAPGAGCHPRLWEQWPGPGGLEAPAWSLQARPCIGSILDFQPPQLFEPRLCCFVVSEVTETQGKVGHGLDLLHRCSRAAELSEASHVPGAGAVSP